MPPFNSPAGGPGYYPRRNWPRVPRMVPPFYNPGGNNVQAGNYYTWGRQVDQWRSDTDDNLDFLQENKLDVDDYEREKGQIFGQLQSFGGNLAECNQGLNSLNARVNAVEGDVKKARDEIKSNRKAWETRMDESDKKVGAVEKKVSQVDKKLDTGFQKLGNLIAETRRGNSGGRESTTESGSTASQGPLAGNQQATGTGLGGIGNNNQGNWQGFMVNTNGGSFHAQNCGQFRTNFQGQCSCMHLGTYIQPANPSSFYTPYSSWPSYSSRESGSRHRRRSISGSGSLNWNETPDITLDLSRTTGGGLFSKSKTEHMLNNLGKGGGGGGSARHRRGSAYDSYR